METGDRLLITTINPPSSFSLFVYMLQLAVILQYEYLCTIETINKGQAFKLQFGKFGDEPILIA